MRYTLLELIEDKKLRIALAERANEKMLEFEDNNGVFSLNFKEQSLLLNHRQTYDTLCELGGEPLLKKLLAGGNTCLTDDPNAAKQGVRPIQGTEKYFLMTNAGPSKAFASILFGLAGWAKKNRAFDAELVCFEDFEEEFGEIEEDDGLLAEWEEPKKTQWLYCGEDCTSVFSGNDQNAVLEQRDGKPVFVDPDSGRLAAPLDLGLYSLHACEPLYAVEGNALSTLLGYRYQLEENGKWGFISRRLACVAPAVYDSIDAADEVVAAWVNRAEDQMDLTLSLTVTNAETGEKDYWLPRETWETLLFPVFEGVSVWYQPMPGATLTEKRLGGGRMAFLYCPYGNAISGQFQLVDQNKKRTTWEPYYENGMLRLQLGGKKIPAGSVTMENCLRALAGSDDLLATACIRKPEWRSKSECIGTYMIRKDGFWALAELNVSGKPVVKQLLTPLAFTKMTQPEGWPEKVLLVERFGKQGVYSWEKERFLIACEYDEISYSERVFTASCADITRKIGLDGRILPEERPTCPRCHTALVKGALYCHMCGVSLMEPEKKETKAEVVQEKPKTEEVKAPKPVPAPPKPPAEVPTLENFERTYWESGKHSCVQLKGYGPGQGNLDVRLRWNDDYEEDTDPEHFLYSDLSIKRKNDTYGGAVSGLSGLKAYALAKDGIFYVKQDEIWFLHTSGERRKLGEQKNVLQLTDDGNGKLTVEYLSRYTQTDWNEHRDECGYMYEAWYNVYRVYTETREIRY